MGTKTKKGYDLTLSILAKTDISVLSGLLGTVLNNQDESDADRTALFLLELNNRPVNRLLLRRYKRLSANIQQAFLKHPEAILQAAQDLAGIDNSEIRKNVIEALAALADRRSIPLMLRYLDDPTGPVRKQAQYLLHVLSRRYSAELAASRGKERDYLRTALRLVLREGDVTDEGLHTLLLLGRDGFLLLLPFLRDETSESCEKITRFLSSENGDHVVRCLLFLATSRFERVRRLSRDILKNRQSSSFLASVVRVITEYSEKELAPLAAMIRHLSWEHLQKEELHHLQEETQDRVLEVVRTFSGAYTQRIRKLLPFLKSTFVSIRATTLQLLWDVPAHLFFKELQPLLHDPSEAIALRATSMLQLHAHPEAFQLLVKQLGNQSSLVREEAAKKLEGRTFHFLSRQWDNLRPEHRSRICKILNRFDAKFPRQLEAEIESNDAMRVLRALSIIRETGTPDSYITLLPDLASFPDPYVRATIAVLLGQCRATSTETVLTMLLQDPDPRVVANSIEALAASRNRKFIKVLTPFLAHWHNRVRATAIVCLTELGWTRIKEPLKSMSADPDEKMRKSARWSINKLQEMVQKNNAKRAAVTEGGMTENKEKEYAQTI